MAPGFIILKMNEIIIRIVEDPQEILGLLHYGTNLPITPALHKYILPEITRMNFRSIVFENEKGDLLAHTCYYMYENTMYFAYFGVPSESPELIDRLIEELVNIGKEHEVEDIRGPINFPHVIYGWGFAEEGSSQEPFVAAPYQNPAF